MRVLVCNLGDNASVNMRDRLLDTGDWAAANGSFRGHPIHQRGYDLLVDIDGPVIHDEALGGDLEDAGWPIGAVWFLSRHRAASGQPSLTVHPIGNHSDADYGGQPRTLSPAAAADMGALLRAVAPAAQRAGLEHSVTYEATHHGPLMRQPSAFLEIGSDEAWYDHRPSAEVWAEAIHTVLDEAVDRHAQPPRPVWVGVGGGHYVPQMTSKALQDLADFGHLVPGYAVDPEADPEGDVLRRAWEATPGADAVYVHKKGLKGPQRQAVKRWIEEMGLATA